MAIRDTNVLFFGAGAVGSSVGAWLAPHHANLSFFDQPAVADALNAGGLTAYLQGHKSEGKSVAVKAYSDLAKVPKPDVILISVKNYSLGAVAELLKNRFGGDTIVVGLQNGVENQRILPQYFSRVVYGIVSYNAWLDAPGVAGYQKKGPLVVGTHLNRLQSERALVAELLGLGVTTEVTNRLADATHSKMIVNLTNSLTTLVGHGFQPISEPALFQRLLSNLTYEGVQIVKAAGYCELQVGAMPSWALMTAAARLPQALTKRAFDKNVKKMVVSSMAQDVLQRKGSDTELESINGYFLAMADANGLKVPYNRAVYELAKENFAKPDFRPLDVRDVWKRVESKLR